MHSSYDVTPAILQFVEVISGKAGTINLALLQKPEPGLRRHHPDQSDQLPNSTLLEFHNARLIYDQPARFNVASLPSFCHAHRMFMQQLIDRPGIYRNDLVRIQSVGKTTYLAPPPADVPLLLDALFAYLRDANEHPLIKSCVVHYEVLRIHPFTDGNGRLARLWQTLLLLREHPVFGFLPVETLIGSTLQDYYRALSLSDAAGNSTVFIEYMLGVIDAAVSDLLRQQTPTLF